MSPKPVVIKFFAPVVDTSINALMNTIDQRMKQGVKASPSSFNNSNNNRNRNISY